MRKVMVVIVAFIGVFILFSCMTTNQNSLQGFYQSEETFGGHLIQVSIDNSNNSFVEYIDNREVNKGIYESGEGKNYKLKGDSRDINIVLEKNNSFEITIKKINNGNPIVLKNIGKVPVTFSTKFEDVDKYKSLIIE